MASRMLNQVETDQRFSAKDMPTGIWKHLVEAHLGAAHDSGKYPK